MRTRRIIAGSIGVAVLATAALRGVLRRFEIREASMAPTLESGDWVVAKRRTGSPARGDIVVFDDPTGTGMNLIKRVIGISGEQVGIDNGRVTVDGAVLADRWASGLTTPDGQWEVPDDNIWVLGDNRSASRSDSRLYGAIPIEMAQWQVVARYWPSTRTGIVG
jgi:signal peptidase I